MRYILPAINILLLFGFTYSAFHEDQAWKIVLYVLCIAILIYQICKEFSPCKKQK